MAKAQLLCLGDSYTIGESVAANDAWPAQLAIALAQAGIKTETTVVAKTGWTTDELAQAIDAAKLRPHYDWVSLLIGVNNQYRQRDLGEFARHYALLLAFAIERTAGQTNRLVGISIPDWGRSDFGQQDPRGSAQIGVEVDQFNAIANAICRAAGVRFVDITTASRASVPGLIAPDGLHPSGLAYQAWVKLILPAALQALGSANS